MKLQTLKIIICPACGYSPLKLDAFDTQQETIIEGILQCSSCKESYLINEGIARMVTRVSGLSDAHREIAQANAEYHNIIYLDYERDGERWYLKDSFNQNRIKDIIFDLSHKTENNYFIDIGCGTGNILRFGQRFFKYTIGVDISFNMLRIARDRGYEVIQADALCLPFRLHTFDVVSAFSLLHHLFDYKQFFTEAGRILKQGGFIYTDWDPQKQPKINEKKLSWRIFVLLDFFGKRLKKIIRVSRKPPAFDLIKTRPEIKNLYEKTEYHNIFLKADRRGIDVSAVKEILKKDNFTCINPVFHVNGRQIQKLPFSAKVRFFFLRYQNYPLERFTENVMFIANKK